MFKRIMLCGVSLAIMGVSLPSISNALTVKEAIVAAQTYNAKLKAADSELSKNKTMAFQSVTPWLPMVTYIRSKTMNAKLGDYTYASNQRPSDQTVSISENLFNGGQDLSSLLAAKSTYDASVMQYNSKREQVFFNTIQAYMDLKRDIDSLNVAKSTENTLSQHYKVTKVRYTAGAATKTDLAQAHARWASAQAASFASQGNVEKSRAVLYKITGIKEVGTLEYPPLPDIPATFSVVVNTAFQYNRGLKIQEATKKSTEYQILKAGGSFLPTVSLEYMWHKGTADEHFQGPQECYENGMCVNSLHEATAQSLKLNFTWALFAQGNRFFGLKMAINGASEMESNLLDAHRSVAEAISEAWTNYKSAQVQITAYEEAVKAQSESLKGVRQQSRSGTRTLTDVLDSERDLDSAQQNLVVAKHNEIVAAYLLLLQMGMLNENSVK